MLSGRSPCRGVSNMTLWHSVGGAWEFLDLLKTWNENLNKVNELLQAFSLCFA